MEIELYNFKKEVAKRFGNSKITKYTFPRLPEVDAQSEEILPNSVSNKDRLKDQWKVIENYHHK